ncbi:hypothetical protein DERP_012055 [Dermatophagoides pteronyssinus]|uniref:Uncharacterized protein n=1 Tax=Dermatophagoides pteronyssinus TaxID=6956 RepID=A0ABQ8ITT9_DERPT|nr:hypothetical protein DERP_012055 [Dermatophagoides pteronyssinus]
MLFILIYCPRLLNGKRTLSILCINRMSKNGWQEMNLLIRYRSGVENENLNPDSVQFDSFG